MNVWKELRTRWMYWRYRNITRNRQRLRMKWDARRHGNPAYRAPTGRGIRPVRPAGSHGVGRTWLLLILVSLAIAVVRQYEDRVGFSDFSLLADLGILVVAYIIWWRTA